MAITLRAKKYVAAIPPAGQTISLTSGWNTSYGDGNASYTPATDDIVIVSYSVGSSGDQTLGVDTAGYTEEAELFADGTNDSNLSVSWKRMGATPDTDVTLSSHAGTALDTASAIIEVWSDVDTTTAIDVTTVTATGINSSAPNPGAITPVTTDAVVIVVAANAGPDIVALSQSGSELSGFLSGVEDATRDSSLASGYFNWTSGAFDPVALVGGSSNESRSAWAAVTLALRPAATGFSQAPGIGLETDTALQLGLAYAAGTAVETETSLALSGRLISTTGVALETDTALALNLGVSIDVGLALETDTALTLTQLLIGYQGAELIVNGRFDKDISSWLPDGDSENTWVDGKLRVEVGGLGNDVGAYQAVTVITTAEYDGSFDITDVFVNGPSTDQGGIKLGIAAGQQGYTSPALKGVGTHTFTVKPTSSTNLYLTVVVQGSGSSDYIVVDNISLRQVTAEKNTALTQGLALGFTTSAETDTALSLAASISLALGVATETDTALAASVVLVEDTGVAAETDAAISCGLGIAVSRADETDTALEVSDLTVKPALETDAAQQLGVGIAAGQGTETDASIAVGLAQSLGLAAETDEALELYNTAVGRSDETDTAVALGAALGVERADEFDGSGTFAPLIVINTGVGEETDTVLSLGLTLGVTYADETDTAFAVGNALPVGIATETSSAFVLGHRLIDVTGLSAEVDIAYARTLALNVAFASETDAALSLSFALARTVGRAEETDTAIELARNLAVLPGYKPDVDLRWLDDVRQLVHRATNKPTAGRFGDPTPEVQIGVLKPPPRRLDDPTPPVHDNSRYN